MVLQEKVFVHGDSQGIELTDLDQHSQPGVDFDFQQYGFLTHREPHFSQILYWKLPQRFLGDKASFMPYCLLYTAYIHIHYAS